MTQFILKFQNATTGASYPVPPVKFDTLEAGRAYVAKLKMWECVKVFSPDAPDFCYFEGLSKEGYYFMGIIEPEDE